MDESPQLLCRMPIPTLGSDCDLEVWKGDLLYWKVEVDCVVFSAFAADVDYYLTGHKDVPDFLIGALVANGLDLAAAFENSVDLRGPLGTWFHDSPIELSTGLRSKSLVCVNPRHPTNQACQPPIHSMFESLYATLGIMQICGHEIATVLVPAMGAGGMKVDSLIVAEALVTKARHGVRGLRALKRVIVVERDQSKAENIRSAVDNYLGLSPGSITNSGLYKPVLNDFQQMVQDPGMDFGGDLEPHLMELLSILQYNKPSATAIAASCRKFAEALVGRYNVPGKNLADQIENLYQHQVPNWIGGYMHVLRKAGNELVHHNPREVHARLTPDDLMVCIVCLLRVLAYLAENQRRKTYVHEG